MSHSFLHLLTTFYMSLQLVTTSYNSFYIYPYSLYTAHTASYSCLELLTAYSRILQLNRRGSTKVQNISQNAYIYITCSDEEDTDHGDLNKETTLTISNAA